MSRPPIRTVRRGFKWEPTPEWCKPSRELLARLREIEECQRRALARARSYAIVR